MELNRGHTGDHNQSLGRHCVRDALGREVLVDHRVDTPVGAVGGPGYGDPAPAAGHHDVTQIDERRDGVGLDGCHRPR